MTSDRSTRWIVAIGTFATAVAFGMSIARARDCSEADRHPTADVYELTFCSPPLDRSIAGDAVPDGRPIARGAYGGSGAASRRSTGAADAPAGHTWKYVTTTADGKRKVIRFPIPTK